MVVLNDNEMSISANVGALSRYLNKIRLSAPVQFFSENIEEQLKQLALCRWWRTGSFEGRHETTGRL